MLFIKDCVNIDSMRSFVCVDLDKNFFPSVVMRLSLSSALKKSSKLLLAGQYMSIR